MTTQVLFLLVVLNNTHCYLPSYLAYNDSVLYIHYGNITEEFFVKSIKTLHHDKYVVADNCMVRFHGEAIYITRKGRTLYGKKITDKEYFELKRALANPRKRFTLRALSP